MNESVNTYICTHVCMYISCVNQLTGTLEKHRLKIVVVVTLEETSNSHDSFVLNFISKIIIIFFANDN